MAENAVLNANYLLARVKSLEEKIRGPTPDPRDVGAFAHAVVQLDGVATALGRLDEVIDRVEEEGLRRELLFFRDQIDRSRAFDSAGGPPR